MVSIQLTLEKTLKLSLIDMKSVQMEENSETLHRFKQFKRCFDTIKARYLMLINIHVRARSWHFGLKH